MSEASFETVYNAEMTCDGCVNDITTKLNKLDGVNNVLCDLNTKTVAVLGTTPPSLILDQLKSRNPILKGTGKSNTAAVAILEDFESNEDLKVKGLARFVGLPNATTFVDLKMSGIPNGLYNASIGVNGDVTKGSKSTGESWLLLGQLKCDDGVCQLYKTFKFNLFEIIGRSVVIEGEGANSRYCGVIARSAGAWENSKYVCSCTGKTVWDEKVDAVNRGIVS